MMEDYSEETITHLNHLLNHSSMTRGIMIRKIGRREEDGMEVKKIV